MTTRPEHRLAYAAAPDRPALALPGGAKLAIWPVVNVEHWLIDRPMPRQVLSPPTGAALLPDVPYLIVKDGAVDATEYALLPDGTRRTTVVPARKASGPRTIVRHIGACHKPVPLLAARLTRRRSSARRHSR